MKCDHCGKSHPRMYMTPDNFKCTFKVGDTIRGFVTRKLMVITAIGETRFLYRSIYSNGDLEKEERVAKMNMAGGNWKIFIREDKRGPTTNTPT